MRRGSVASSAGQRDPSRASISSARVISLRRRARQWPPPGPRRLTIKPGLAELGQELVQVGFGNILTAGDVVALDRSLTVLLRQLEHRPNAILGASGDSYRTTTSSSPTCPLTIVNARKSGLSPVRRATRSNSAHPDSRPGRYRCAKDRLANGCGSGKCRPGPVRSRPSRRRLRTAAGRSTR